jgi:hypothetical protein
MTFLMFWGASMFTELIIALVIGFDVFRNVRGTLFGLGALAILPAAILHFGVMKSKHLIERWQIRRGEDVNKLHDYEDSEGYIHIAQIPDAEKQRDIPLSELVSGVEQVENDWEQSN